MNKLFRSFVITLTMLFLLSPICFGATPELKKQIKKSPQAIADFKIMPTFATANQK